MKVIDVEGAVLGRVSTQLAKDLLKGEKIIVVNAGKAVMTGKIEDIYFKYKQRLDRSDRANPTKGPHFPRTPNGIFKRAVRGMINHRKQRGKEALRNLRVYTGVPEEYQDKKETHSIRPPKNAYITLNELSKELGWRNEQ